MDHKVPTPELQDVSPIARRRRKNAATNFVRYNMPLKWPVQCQEKIQRYIQIRLGVTPASAQNSYEMILLDGIFMVEFTQ